MKAEYAKLNPEKLAIWSASGKTWVGPQYQVLVHLDEGLVDWLMEHLVGQTTEFGDLDETISTALRCLAGREGEMDIETLRDIRNELISPDRGWSVED